MWLWQLIKSFGRVLCLKAEPSIIPYSKILLAALIGMLVLIKAWSNVWLVQLITSYETKRHISLDYTASMLVVAVSILILFAFVRTMLWYYNLTERTVQLFSVLLSVDLVVSLLSIIWLLGLSFAHLPLEPNTAGSLTLLLSFILLVYWQFIIYMYIFFYSLNVKALLAGVFALVYLLLQHNVSDLLMNQVIQISR